jgi:hypothetical protein
VIVSDCSAVSGSWVKTGAKVTALDLIACMLAADVLELLKPENFRLVATAVFTVSPGPGSLERALEDSCCNYNCLVL